MALESLSLEHVPPTHSIHVAFFKDVSNAEFLQSRLLARDPEFEYAFIDASSVISRLQVAAAVYKAITVLLDGALRTPNVHSEIVLALSSSMNIAEAYRRWGISSATKDLIVVKVLFPSASGTLATKPPHDVSTHLQTHVKGTRVPFADEEIASSTDWTKLKKYYKLNGATKLESIKNEKHSRKEAEALILGAMALRGV